MAGQRARVAEHLAPGGAVVGRDDHRRGGCARGAAAVSGQRKRRCAGATADGGVQLVGFAGGSGPALSGTGAGRGAGQPDAGGGVAGSKKLPDPQELDGEIRYCGVMV